MNKNYLLLLMILAIPFVLSASITNVTIEDAVLNTNITVDGTVYFDVLDWGSGGIYFENYSTALTGERLITTFNITDTDTAYSQTDLPYIYSSSLTEKVISSNIPNDLNITLYLTVENCGITTQGGLQNIIMNGRNVSFTCLNRGQAYLTTNISAGYTSVGFNTIMTPAAIACRNIIDKLSIIAVFLGLLIVAFFAYIILVLFDKMEFKMEAVVTFITTIVSMSVYIAIQFFVLQAICMI